MASYQNADDEIDLIELVTSLWREKWTILFFVFVFFIPTFMYSHNQGESFKITSTYQINLYSIFIQQICGSNSFDTTEKLHDCLNSGTINISKDELGTSWKWNQRKNQLTHITKEPSSFEHYSNLFANISEKTTSKLKQQAQIELSIVEENSKSSFAQSERAAMNFLNAKRLISSVDKGTNAITFSQTSIKKENKNLIIILASSLFGAIIGCFVVFFRSTFNKTRTIKTN